jgi:RNA polymerase sigma factor (sigma-70 family)
MSVHEMLGEIPISDNPAGVTLGLPDYDVDPANEAIVEEGISTKEVDGQIAGWEYDQFVKTYMDHPKNNLKVRYARDCEGFDVDKLKPFDSLRASSSDEDVKLFAARMRQFPLIKNLQHQQLLKKRILQGKEAHETLTSGVDLAPEDIQALKELAIEGAGSFITMFECNLRLVMKIARKQKESATYSIGDAVEDGCLGLRRAIQKYDPEKGYAFSTYATRWIRQSIQRGHMAIAYGAAIPSGAYSDLRQVVKERDLASEKGERVTDSELVEMGYNEAHIAAVNRFFSLGRISLDAPTGVENETTLSELIESPNTEFEESIDADVDSRRLLTTIMDSGPIKDSRDLAVLALHEGVFIPGVDYQKIIKIGDHQEATIGEYVAMVRRSEITIGRKDLIDVFGISRERIRQIYDKARAHILAMGSIEAIKDRLLLSDSELEEIQRFSQIDSFGNRGLITPRKEEMYQQRAQKVVSLLRLMDADFDTALSDTMDILADRFNYDEATLNGMNKWLQHRYGYVQTDKIPMTTRKAKMKYGFNATRAVVIESIYLAVLSGTWGKVPEGIRD